MENKPSYRADIDGLRALAVLAVIFFHFKIGGLSGGFVGVDIFFVISGFLITSIIARELQAGNFSFLKFWSRRVRRIVPVLFVVLIATTLASYFVIYYPNDLITYGKSLFALSIFLSNIFFLRRDGYFATPSETEPLLHTWSLSLEEQFYIVLPFLLFFVYRFFSNKITLIIGLLVLSSFLFNLYLTIVAPLNLFDTLLFSSLWAGAANHQAAFYFLLSRAWELGAGSLLALSTYSLKNKLTAEIYSLVGLLLIIVGFFVIVPANNFPGFWALLPVLGTVLVIFANQNHNTITKNILSFNPLVWVGLISYSLYLWHWPLYVLAGHYFHADYFTDMQILSLLLLSFGLAFISYKTIEQPFRKYKPETSYSKVILLGILSLLVTAAVGWLIATKAIERGAPMEAAQIFFEESNQYGGKKLEECNQSPTLPCLLGAGNDNDISFVLWGDSHAGAIITTIDEQAKERRVSGVAFIGQGCLPIFLFDPQTTKESCIEKRIEAKNFMENKEVSHLLLVGSWMHYQELILPNKQINSEDYFTDILTDTLDNLDIKNIFIMQQIPTHEKYNVREIYTKMMKNPEKNLDLSTYATTYENNRAGQAFTISLINKLATKPNVSIIDPTAVLCPNHESCLLMNNDEYLYKDISHLTPDGAKFIESVFSEFFETLLIADSPDKN